MIPHSRGAMLWRFLLAAVVVIAATAATTAVAGLLQFKQLTSDLNLSPPLTNANVTLPPAGGPQTILVIGSDHRAGTSFATSNTDTMLLVRLDPNSSTINVLSIPRDLEVQIPGHGTARINAAYSLGGPNLMIRTIKQNVFPQLRVNHIIDVNFGGFSNLVDAIGCVYAQADHRYYNNTLYTNYSSIDVQPGYQRLCGDNQTDRGALAFVRFRHTDSDIVRNARQQDFIRWAKENYSTTQLLSDRDRLLSIFGAHAQTDSSLHTTDGLINLFNLVLNSDAHTIKSIHFPALLNNCLAPAPGQAAPPCYVNANQTDEARVWRELITETKPAAASAATSGAARNTKVAVRRGRHGGGPSGPPPGLASDPADGRAQARQLNGVRMPVYYPAYVVAGSQYCTALTANCDDPMQQQLQYARSYPRGYTIRAPSGARYPAYYMTIEINTLRGEYYGVQGTAWQHPPLLDHPSATKVVNGKTLQLFAAGSKLTTVAWKTRTGVYWIANTLTASIPNSQMVAIAASLTR